VKKKLFVAILCLFILNACGMSASPMPTQTALPTVIIVATVTPSPIVIKATDVPTPTAMPKNDGTILVASLSNDATQEEIAKALFTQWLEHAKTTGSLDDYEVIKVNVIKALSGDRYGVDFVAGVGYSVLPSKNGRSSWAAGNGLIVDGDPWIRNKGFFIGIRRDNDVYVLDILGTGP
jgi:hypothetical protein